MRFSFKDQFILGFCFLLTSKNYLKGAFCDNYYGTGPWWMSFDWSLPSIVKKLPMIKRLSSPLTELRIFAEWGIDISPEFLGITIDITADQSGFSFNIKDLIRKTGSVYT